METNQPQLSENETNLLELLTRGTLTNYWVPILRKTAASGNVSEVKKMILEVRNQAEEHPRIVEQMIGAEAYRLLIAL